MSFLSKHAISILLLVLGTQVQAQNATNATVDSGDGLLLGFTADVGELNEKGEVPLFTEKYNGYDSAQVFFNALVVKITVNKKQLECNAEEKCTPSLEAPEVVYFDVTRVERVGCYDSYHAKKRDIHNSQIVEKVIIQRLANSKNERCQGMKSLPLATIHYRVIGINSETQELGWAHVFAKLLNLKPLKK
jgi:hypothetical protein